MVAFSVSQNKSRDEPGFKVLGQDFCSYFMFKTLFGHKKF